MILSHKRGQPFSISSVDALHKLQHGIGRGHHLLNIASVHLQPVLYVKIDTKSQPIPPRKQNRVCIRANVPICPDLTLVTSSSTGDDEITKCQRFLPQLARLSFSNRGGE